jgi:hypothetical protein
MTLFADRSERARQQRSDARIPVNERRRVVAVCDAIQLALVKGQLDRTNMMLKEMHAVVERALADRRVAAVEQR